MIVYKINDNVGDLVYLLKFIKNILMKFRSFLNIIGLMSFSFFMSSCCLTRDCEDDYFYTDPFEAVVMTREDLESSIKVLPKQAMDRAGKIYLKEQWMFIGDHNTGFHIYDNSQPEQPIEVAFLNLPGATDLAIRGNVFYVNQAVDLVAFTLDVETKKISILKRVKNVFPSMTSPSGGMNYLGDNHVIVDWKIK